MWFRAGQKKQKHKSAAVRQGGGRNTTKYAKRAPPSTAQVLCASFPFPLPHSLLASSPHPPFSLTSRHSCSILRFSLSLPLLPSLALPVSLVPRGAPCSPPPSPLFIVPVSLPAALFASSSPPPASARPRLSLRPLLPPLSPPCPFPFPLPPLSLFPFGFFSRCALLIPYFSFCFPPFRAPLPLSPPFPCPCS